MHREQKEHCYAFSSINMRGFDPSGGRGSYIVDPCEEKIERWASMIKVWYFFFCF